MQIKEACIYQFGKLQNKKIEFAPGLNVIYGKNEAGKSTLHTFLKAMMFGMEKTRGRSAAGDCYSLYEPWHAPSYYSGSIRFSAGQQSFYLERNFYSKEKSDCLRNELDGEELSVAFGDLTMLLGGIRKETYENTYDIPQSGAATGTEMVRILSTYLAQAEDGSDGGVSVSEAVEALNARKKELQQEQKKVAQEREARVEKLLVEKDFLTEECGKLRETVQKFEAEQKKRMENECQRTGKGYLTGIAGIFLAMLAAIEKNNIAPLIFLVVETLLLAVSFFCIGRNFYRNRERKVEKTENPAAEMLSELRESLQEKENRLFNLEEEVERESVLSENERRRAQDIQALELAAEEIKRLSKTFYEDMKDELNAQISKYVSLFTGNAYDSVRLNGEGKLQILTEGKEVAPQALSRGTFEQIYLALRIAVGAVVAKEESLPVLFDEAFAMYDDERLAQTLCTLSKMDNQIFLFTCQHREEETLKRLGIAYHLTIL